ncbi:hypothetical protein [Arcobacter vandammei]|uniref:hypothetical protein n=1 Tax=Arcobacter vandammei TaxID=2782243 RepID=UPI0018DFE25A|nr:hypothetical protein [Arcobacter vandammei]
MQSESIIQVIKYILLISTVGILFFIDIELALFIDLYLYSLIMWYCVVYKKFDIINFMMFSVFLLMSIFYYIFNIKDVIPYTGIVIYINFIFLTIYFIFTNRTLTYIAKQYTNEEKKPILYTNIFSIFSYALAIALSFLLKPNILYIILPIVIIVLTSIYLNKIRRYFNSKFEKKEILFKQQSKEKIQNLFSDNEIFSKEFKDCKYLLKEVSSNEELATFNNLLRISYEQYVPLLKNSSKDDYFDEILIKELDEYSKLFILYLEDSTPIATLKISLKDINNKLPLEYITLPKNQTLPKLDQLFKVAEYGKLSIVPKYRNGEILDILFRGTVFYIIENKVSIIYSDAYIKVASIYEKMGFKHLHKDEIIDINSHKSKIMYLNISHIISNIYSDFKEDIDKDTLFEKIKEYLDYLKNSKINNKYIFEQTDLHLKLEQKDIDE